MLIEFLWGSSDRPKTNRTRYDKNTHFMAIIERYWRLNKYSAISFI